LFFLLSCGKAAVKDPRRFFGIDEDLQAYVDEYEALKGSSIKKNIAVGFFDLPEPQVGLCVEYDTGEKEIYIDPEFWYNAASEQQKLAIVLHEFSHCDLGRAHNNKLREDGTPVSIMYYSIFDWHEDYEYYIEELFSNL
jgi:hypothetical protein